MYAFLFFLFFHVFACAHAVHTSATRWPSWSRARVIWGHSSSTWNASARLTFWKAPSIVALLSPSTRALAYLRISVCTSRHELTQAHVHACVCVYICLPRLYVCLVCTRVCVCTYVYHAYMYALYVCARVCVYICIPRLYVCLICMPYMYARVCAYMYTTPQRFHPLT